MQTTFTVTDLACSACADKIDMAIRTIDPQAKIFADANTKLVRIESELPSTTLENAVVAAGYTIAK
jgi:copper chaperone